MSAKIPKLVKCPFCGYFWWTKSSKKWICCPKCKKKFKPSNIASNEADFYINIYAPSAKRTAEALENLAKGIKALREHVENSYLKNLEEALIHVAKNLRKGAFASGYLAEKLVRLAWELGSLSNSCESEKIFNACMQLEDFIARFCWKVFWRDNPFLKPLNNHIEKEWAKLAWFENIGDEVEKWLKNKH